MTAATPTQSPSVAIIGASDDRDKFGNKAVRAFLHRGYRVFPVNPRGGTIEGLRVYRSVREIGEKVDMASFYVHPEVGLSVIEDVAAAGIAEVWLNPGAESRELVARAWALGLQPIVACSIVGIGESPGMF